jgi:hypothetical protein
MKCKCVQNVAITAVSASFHWTLLEKLKNKTLYEAVFIRLTICHPGSEPIPSDSYLFNFAWQIFIKSLEEFLVSLKLNIKNNGHFSCSAKCVSTFISRLTRYQLLKKNRTRVLEKYTVFHTQYSCPYQLC